MTDDSLNRVLNKYDALQLSNEQVATTYPKAEKLVRISIKDGMINKDSVNKDDKKAYRKQVTTYMQQKGFKPQQELFH